MKVTTSTLLKLLSLCMGLVFLSCKSDSDKKDFTFLFQDGKFDGWYAKIKSGNDSLAKKVFSINSDGVIHVFKDFPKEYELNAGEDVTHGMLYSKKKYSKFIFRFEYKWGKVIANNFDRYQYDAGMYYHVVDDKIFPKGLEYQVRYNHHKDKNHTGDYWGKEMKWYSKDSITFLPPSQGGNPISGHRGEHLALKNVQANGLNDKWNTCEVIVMGNQYSIHKLNGQIVNMATDLPYSEGIIGLQSETAEIFYRNIEIKEFDSIVPIENFIE